MAEDRYPEFKNRYVFFTHIYRHSEILHNDTQCLYK